MHVLPIHGARRIRLAPLSSGCRKLIGLLYKENEKVAKELEDRLGIFGTGDALLNLEI